MRLPRLGFLDDRAAARDFSRLEPGFREIVFYSEGSGDWPHLGPVVESLLDDHGRRVSYLTSDPADPGLHLDHELLRAFMIGAGTTRTALFRTIDCRQFVMTIPDLDQLWLKRSVHPVHYVYVFHSTNSTHTVYRKGAFDAYDAIMCVGPYHVDEIRRTEEHYGLKPKELLEAGSVKLDTVMKQFADLAARRAPNDPPEILVAPSWGLGSLIEMPVGRELLRVLLEAGLPTTLRLHPMTVRHHPRLPDELRATFGDQPLLRLENDMNATESWLRSDLMISDWSGAATEYAFALEKPVIFIGTPQKVRNPEWKVIGLPSFEDLIRGEVGTVIQLAELASLPDEVQQSIAETASAQERVAAARSRWIYSEGESAAVISRELSEALDP